MRVFGRALRRRTVGPVEPTTLCKCCQLVFELYSAEECWGVVLNVGLRLAGAAFRAYSRCQPGHSVRISMASHASFRRGFWHELPRKVRLVRFWPFYFGSFLHFTDSRLATSDQIVGFTVKEPAAQTGRAGVEPGSGAAFPVLR